MVKNTLQFYSIITTHTLSLYTLYIYTLQDIPFLYAPFFSTPLLGVVLGVSFSFLFYWGVSFSFLSFYWGVVFLFIVPCSVPCSLFIYILLRVVFSLSHFSHGSSVHFLSLLACSIISLFMSCTSLYILHFSINTIDKPFSYYVILQILYTQLPLGLIVFLVMY